MQLAVLAGDFLLSRACITLASLKNTEVVSLIATAVEHLVTGETMQMSTSAEQRSSMDYYLQKTYYKTASLISNSCKSIALLTGQTAEVSMLAYEYGKNLKIEALTSQVMDLQEENHHRKMVKEQLQSQINDMAAMFNELPQSQFPPPPN
ncbi:solanesyl-diphosphate synthase 1, mitochondrial-like [Cynara cardunculus var. scolymus]|uniref:solanesyl-diphosphate synthase 1, mitochondrial-like n=1 Tax=Cynara cardunculus var. scolymus TaxID=59895 RepID=UPI000D628B90|nr:solanesyl-diphosphate synthase 1, mitochondrial-like [Cynara cardunculus var. scolymus]